MVKTESRQRQTFLSGLMKSIPPMNEMFDMAGMELPSYLGKNKEVMEAKAVAEKAAIEKAIDEE